jgi:hypothetical protein
MRKIMHAQALERDSSPVVYAFEDVRKSAQTGGITHGTDLDTVDV